MISYRLDFDLPTHFLCIYVGLYFVDFEILLENKCLEYHLACGHENITFSLERSDLCRLICPFVLYKSKLVKVLEALFSLSDSKFHLGQ